MKEIIKELIKRYTLRVEALVGMQLVADSGAVKKRLNIKKNVYLGVIRDLKLLLRDEEEH